jgi:hypothetical protein
VSDDEERPAAEGAPSAERDALLSRLRVIEDQPLESRAEALANLHDELRARLESGDAPRG